MTPYIIVPNVYPVDIFEHMWALDRLQRLGISRYFEPEMKELIAYVFRYYLYDTFLVLFGTWKVNV